jgi:hypothetical protein
MTQGEAVRHVQSSARPRDQSADDAMHPQQHRKEGLCSSSRASPLSEPRCTLQSEPSSPDAGARWYSLVAPKVPVSYSRLLRRLRAWLLSAGGSITLYVTRYS